MSERLSSKKIGLTPKIVDIKSTPPPLNIIEPKLPRPLAPKILRKKSPVDNSTTPPSNITRIFVIKKNESGITSPQKTYLHTSPKVIQKKLLPKQDTAVVTKPIPAPSINKPAVIDLEESLSSKHITNQIPLITPTRVINNSIPVPLLPLASAATISNQSIPPESKRLVRKFCLVSPHCRVNESDPANNRKIRFERFYNTPDEIPKLGRPQKTPVPKVLKSEYNKFRNRTERIVMLPAREVRVTEVSTQTESADFPPLQLQRYPRLLRTEEKMELQQSADTSTISASQNMESPLGKRPSTEEDKVVIPKKRPAILRSYHENKSHKLSDTKITLKKEKICSDSMEVDSAVNWNDMPDIMHVPSAKLEKSSVQSTSTNSPVKNTAPVKSISTIKSNSKDNSNESSVINNSPNKSDSIIESNDNSPVESHKTSSITNSTIANDSNKTPVKQTSTVKSDSQVKSVETSVKIESPIKTNSPVKSNEILIVDNSTIKCNETAININSSVKLNKTSDNINSLITSIPPNKTPSRTIRIPLTPNDIQFMKMKKPAVSTETLAQFNLLKSKVSADLMEKARQDYNNCLIPDSRGNLPLHRAVMTCHEPSIVRQAIVLKSCIRNIDIRNKAGMTPLHMALFYDCKKSSIQKLMNYGARLDLRDGNSNTVLHLATMHSSPECLTVLPPLVHKIVNDVNDDGLSALHLAVMEGKEEHVHFLISIPNIDINLPDGKSGRTALFHALEYGHNNLALLLIRHGGDRNANNFAGQSIMTLGAESEQFKDVVTLITKKRINRKKWESLNNRNNNNNNGNVTDDDYDFEDDDENDDDTDSDSNNI